MVVSNIPRRHDLDSLRAIAMLLGVVLHAALSFTNLPWVITDTHQSTFFDVLFAVIHGFRMPLFFLLSGFFTAMLWRRRGLFALLKHRVLRILVPMIVGLVTVVPCMFALTSHFSNVNEDARRNATLDSTGRGAIIVGDYHKFMDAVARDDFDANFVSPDDGLPLIVSAAFFGRYEMVETLIEKGANVDLRGSNGGTALHAAAFLGREKSARILIENGADIQAEDNNGANTRDALKTDWGTTNYIANLFGAAVEEHQVMSGRKAIAELIHYDGFFAGEVEPSRTANRLRIQFLMLFPLFFHLWFLWFLCLYVVVFIFYCLTVSRVNFKSFIPSRLIKSPICLIWLVPLTMLPMSYMEPGVFGPDTSVGLLPIPRVFFYYAIFFFFGAIYWEYGDEETQIGKMWWLWLLLSLLVIFPTAWLIAEGQAAIEFKYKTLVYNFLQSSYVWLMIIGSMGLFHFLFAKENKTMRYLSDSSYWLYIAHLPLIMIVQWWVRDWDVHPLVKFLGICVSVTAVLLLSYDWLVRYSFIGRVLNGKRQRGA